MFNNMKLSTKIYSGFAIIMIFLAGVSALSLTRLSSIGQAIELQVEDSYPKTVAANNVIGMINEVARCLRNMLLMEKKEDIEKEYARIEEIRKRATDEFEKLQKTLSTDKGKEIFQGILAARAAYTIPQKETIRLALEGKKKEATDLLFKEVRPLQLAYFNKVNELIQYVSDVMQKHGKEAIELEQNALKLISVISIAALIFSVVTAFFIVRSITGPIRRIIEGLTEGAEEVASASGQVSSAAQSLAEGSSEQAASIEETSSSLEEMSSMTKQNADNSQQANSLMGEAKQVVGTANESMGQLTLSMAEITKASEETSKIIKTIDEIAFQTNLLALNAAVEAARAGEAGAGFAVVADEVRNLAMRAADAAKNTANLIEGTVKKIKDGSELVGRTNEAFKQVAGSSAKAGDLVAEISAASTEQAQGIGQINTAVTELDKVTQQNAANAEESASAAEEMSAQAETMKGMVDELVAIVGSSGKAQRADFGSGRHAQKSVKPHQAIASAIKKLKSKAGSARKSAKPLAEAVIPLDDDKQFSDF